MKKIPFLMFTLLCLSSSRAVAETIYQSPKDFLSEVFNHEVPDSEMLSIFGSRKKAAAKILTHSPSMLRTRYWRRGAKTVWILEEIGKVKPITAGFVVDNAELRDVRVLIYRESHGAEVRHSFFTDQFRNTRLVDEKKLDRSIDGISGATLSVNSMRRMAALALFFDSEVREQ